MRNPLAEKRQKRPSFSKSLAEFTAAAVNKVKIIFCQGVYLTENTARHANVRVVRFRRTASALQRAATRCRKSPKGFFDSPKRRVRKDPALKAQTFALGW